MQETKALQTLMQQAKMGDTDAFALLYENFYTPIFRYVLRKISDSAEAEDLTQTVFMKAFAARENFTDQHPSPIAYFYTIARNLITDTYRKKDRTPVTVDAEKDEDFWDRVPDKEADPMEQFVAQESSVHMHHLLDGLKPAYREVLEMKFLQDLSNTEIATKTGKTEANIRQIQVRSLRQLRQNLQSNH